MADNNNGHVYDVSRDSYMCVSADVQGFLEKKGVLGSRSKLWCSIQQSTLYMQKPTATKSQRQADVVKTIDLKDCHQVRKVTTEITGAHFEICQGKKTHVFICPTSDNCTIWVKALQAAMALKDARLFDSDCAATANIQESTNVYEDVDERLRHSKQSAVSAYRIADYCEPSDVKKASRVVNKDNEYYEVGDIPASFGTSRATSQSINNNSSAENLSKETCSDVKSGAVKAGECDCEQEVYSDGLSLAAEEKITVSVTSQEDAALTLRNSVVRRGSESNEYSDAYSTTSVHHHLHPPRSDSLKPTELDDLKDTVNDDEDETPFQALLDSLTSRDSEIPDYVHPLTTEDMKPLEDLREFLDKNDDLCHVNYLFLPTEDPVSSLKSFLETLSIATSDKTGGHW
ncbi:hypothetical protein BsWGS_20911 [Bradybaena similaris]